MDFSRLPADLGLTDTQRQQLTALQMELQSVLGPIQTKLQSILTSDQLEKLQPLDGLAVGGPSIADLGLSQQQAERIQKLLREMYAATEGLRQELEDARFELSLLKWDTAAGEAALKEKAEEVSQLDAQLSNIVEEYQEKIEAVLTSEQLQKVKSVRSLLEDALGGRGFGGFSPGPASRPGGPTGPAAPPLSSSQK
ncbi:MAG TPA: hypothetical protein GXX50_09215 [Firmicutes bacterium]|nr:hypothetical protein [Bacillota bacterium]